MERDIQEAAVELRRARLRSGLTIDRVAAAVCVSPSTILRNELGRTPGLPPALLARHASTVGLRARIRLYPEGGPIHDAGQVALIRRFRERLGHVGRWAFEVPIPIPGDQRAIDAVLTLPSGSLGLEFYVRLADVQAQLRLAHLKQRDAELDRMVIVVKATNSNRRALREADAAMADGFPSQTRRLMASLAAGELPATNGVILL